MLVAFEETTKIIPQLIAKGIGPEDIQIYFVDGNLANYYGLDEGFDLTGVKGTLPGVGDPDPGFNDQLLGDRPEAEGLQLRSAVLRRHDAHRARGASRPVTTPVRPSAPKSSTSRVRAPSARRSRSALSLLEDGEDIDYDGVSGPADMNDTGSPSAARSVSTSTDGQQVRADRQRLRRRAGDQ